MSWIPQTSLPIKFGWYETSKQWTRLATTVMIFLSGNSWKKQILQSTPNRSNHLIVALVLQSHADRVPVRGSLWMRGLKYTLESNTINPISLLGDHIAHVHERQRHPDCVLPDDGSISQYTHRTHRRTIRRVCSCLPDLDQQGQPPAPRVMKTLRHDTKNRLVKRRFTRELQSNILIRRPDQPCFHALRQTQRREDRPGHHETR